MKDKKPNFCHMSVEELTKLDFSNSGLVSEISRIMAFAHYYGIKDSSPDDALLAVAKILSVFGDKKRDILGDKNQVIVVGLEINHSIRRKMLIHTLKAALHILNNEDSGGIWSAPLMDMDYVLKAMAIYSEAFARNEVEADTTSFPKETVEAAQERFSSVVAMVQGNRSDKVAVSMQDMGRVFVRLMQDSLKSMKEQENDEIESD